MGKGGKPIGLSLTGITEGWVNATLYCHRGRATEEIGIIDCSRQDYELIRDAFMALAKARGFRFTYRITEPFSSKKVIDEGKCEGADFRIAVKMLVEHILKGNVMDQSEIREDGFIDSWRGKKFTHLINTVKEHLEKNETNPTTRTMAGG